MNTEMQELEQRIKELQARVEQRTAQLDLPTNSATAFGRWPIHLQNLYAELEAAAKAYVVMRWRGLEILEKMRAA